MTDTPLPMDIQQVADLMQDYAWLVLEYAEAAYQLADENETLRAELQAMQDAVDTELF